MDGDKELIDKLQHVWHSARPFPQEPWDRIIALVREHDGRRWERLHSASKNAKAWLSRNGLEGNSAYDDLVAALDAIPQQVSQDATKDSLLVNQRWEAMKARPGCAVCGAELNPLHPTVAYCSTHQTYSTGPSSPQSADDPLAGVAPDIRRAAQPWIDASKRQAPTADTRYTMAEQLTQLTEAKAGWDSCISDLKKAADICSQIETENAALKSENERLDKQIARFLEPISDEERRVANHRAGIRCWTKDEVESLIANRLEPKGRPINPPQEPK